MGFDKPSDLFVMVGVFVIVLLVATLGIESIKTQGNASIGENLSRSIFIVNQSVGNLSQTVSTINDALIDDSGAADSPTSDSIIVKSWNALKSLGQSFTTAEKATNDAARLFGIDTRIVGLALGILLTLFAVIMYAYIRGIK